MTDDAKMLMRVLVIGLRTGEITPKRRITGRELAKRYNVKFNAQIDSSDVRSWINELCSAGYPVCSNNEGYCWGINAEEIQESIAHRLSRIAKQQQAIRGLQQALKRVTDASLFPPEETDVHPVVAALKKEFGAELVRSANLIDNPFEN